MQQKGDERLVRFLPGLVLVIVLLIIIQNTGSVTGRAVMPVLIAPVAPAEPDPVDPSFFLVLAGLTASVVLAVVPARKKQDLVLPPPPGVEISEDAPEGHIAEVIRKKPHSDVIQLTPLDEEERARLQKRSDEIRKRLRLAMRKA